MLRWLIVPDLDDGGVEAWLRRSGLLKLPVVPALNVIK